MGGLDVIMIGDFYQAPPFSIIALNYWLEYVQCY
jgi:hypothetical protein